MSIRLFHVLVSPFWVCLWLLAIAKLRAQPYEESLCESLASAGRCQPGKTLQGQEVCRACARACDSSGNSLCNMQGTAGIATANNLCPSMVSGGLCQPGASYQGQRVCDMCMADCAASPHNQCSGGGGGGGGSSPVPAPRPSSGPAPRPFPSRPQTTCAEPPDCIVGGYSFLNGQTMSWDVCTGCWSETCVKDVDLTAEASQFRAGDYKKSYELALKVLEKVYPMGAEMFRVAEAEFVKTNNPRFNHCLTKFLNYDKVPDYSNFPQIQNVTAQFKDFMQLNTVIHENTHCSHSALGWYRPGVEFSMKFEMPNTPSPFAGQDGFDPIVTDTSWNNAFPERKEILNDVIPEARSDGMIEGYFDELGDQRIHGLLTESQGYLHGVSSSSWLSSAVGKPNNYKPPGEVNLLHEGNPYPLAIWCYANVVYIQKIKSAYPATWKKLLGEGNDKKYTETGRLLLAIFDRYQFLMRLYLDKNNGAEDVDRKAGYMDKVQKYRQEIPRVLEKADVIAELRSAQPESAGGTCFSIPGSSILLQSGEERLDHKETRRHRRDSARSFLAASILQFSDNLFGSTFEKQHTPAEDL